MKQIPHPGKTLPGRGFYSLRSKLTCINNKPAVKKNLVIESICGVFILLFVYSAGSKLMAWKHFKEILAKMPIIQHLSGWITIGIPSVELSIAVLLFFPCTRVYGLYASCALLMTFTIYLAYMIMMMPSLPCNCGGVIEQLTWRQHIAFNMFFIALSGIAIKGYHKNLVATQSLPVQLARENAENL